MKVVVSRLEDFPPGERKIVKAGPRSIGVFNVEGEFFAIRNRCPHQGGPLCLGRLSPWAVATAPGKVEMSVPHPPLADPETGGDALDEGVRRAEEQPLLSSAARASGREPGPYVAETFRVYVEEDYVVVDV